MFCRLECWAGLGPELTPQPYQAPDKQTSKVAGRRSPDRSPEESNSHCVGNWESNNLSHHWFLKLKEKNQFYYLLFNPYSQVIDLKYFLAHFNIDRDVSFIICTRRHWREKGT